MHVREQGFSMVELLVVIAIIGLLTATVLFVMPDPRGRLRDDAERFAARTAAARDAAIIGAREMAVTVDGSGYRFERRRDGRWTALTDKPLRPAQWQPGTSASAGRASVARIVFDSTGLASQPLTVTLAREAERATVSIAIDGAVRVGS
jgi:general secretion pathway protein H